MYLKINISYQYRCREGHALTLIATLRLPSFFGLFENLRLGSWNSCCHALRFQYYNNYKQINWSCDIMTVNFFFVPLNYLVLYNITSTSTVFFITHYCSRGVKRGVQGGSMGTNLINFTMAPFRIFGFFAKNVGRPIKGNYKILTMPSYDHQDRNDRI